MIMNKVDELITMYVYYRDYDLKPHQIRDGKIYYEDMRAMQILAKIDNDTQEQKRRSEENDRRLKEQNKQQSARGGLQPTSGPQQETLEY